MTTKLVFKGGGVRGAAYAGALKVLEDSGILKGIQIVCGSSAGAIGAMLVSLKYSAEGIREIMFELDFSSVKDDWNPERLFTRYGIYSGDRIHEWIEMAVKIQAGPLATFRILKQKGFLDLHVVATDVNAQSVQLFSYDTTPDVIVSESVLASMSIPFFFPAQKVGGMPSLYCDGGVTLNYPFILMPDALGLYLTNITPQPSTKIAYGSAEAYALAVFESILSAQDISVKSNAQIMANTIEIDSLGIVSTDFGITQDQVQSLYQSGIDCTSKFIKTYVPGNAQ